MSLIKRIATTVHASVEKSVASMENHDAMIQATLKDSRRSVAAANVKLQRLKDDEQRQIHFVEELKARIEQWSSRAKSIAGSDQDKALECLQQRRIDQGRLTDAEHALTKHQALTHQMQDNVSALQQRVNALQSQHLELQSRDTVSRATTQLDDLERSSHTPIDSMFDRWEESIQEREMRSRSMPIDTRTTQGKPVHASVDLHSQFKAAEERAELQQELDDLMADKP